MTSAEELTPLAREIHEADNLATRPDLILRLVDLLFLLVPDRGVPS